MDFLLKDKVLNESNVCNPNYAVEISIGCPKRVVQKAPKPSPSAAMVRVLTNHFHAPPAYVKPTAVVLCYHQQPPISKQNPATDYPPYMYKN